MDGFFAYMYFLIYIMPYVLFVIAPAILLISIFATFFISNLKTGLKNNWMKKNVTGTGIFGAFLLLSVAAFMTVTIVYFTYVPYPASSSDNNTAESALTIYNTLKNIIIFY